jgi:exo-beta-1,3-glucanase (GH17 family)
MSIGKQLPFVPRKFDPFLGGEWIGNAVSYGFYRKGQAPGIRGPSETEILEDLGIISRYWKLIRVYGSDDDSERLLKVIEHNNIPVKVMLGVWLENESSDRGRRKENLKEAEKGIELGNRYPGIITAINVGNETQIPWSAHRMKQKSLLNYIRMVRSNTDQPVTTADDYNFWNKEGSKEIADEIDFIVTHIYALWNGKSLDEALDWMDRIYYQEVKAMHPNKEIIIGETGWATDYDRAKTGPGQQASLIKGEVSGEAQGKYLVQHYDWVMKNRITTFLFEAFDEPWKGGGDSTGPHEVEKNWGVFYENRRPKESFSQLLDHLKRT